MNIYRSATNESGASRDVRRHDSWNLSRRRLGFQCRWVKNKLRHGRIAAVKFERGAIAATILGMTLLPPVGIAAMNEDSQPNAAIYAQAAGTANPSIADDVTLKRTAVAFVKAREISVKADQAIDRTDDTTKKQQLATESESDKIAAVKAEGMEPQQYNSILQMVQNDSSLRQKFLSYVQELNHAS